MIIDWNDTIVTTISGQQVKMPNEAIVSMFTEHDLTHIGDDHYEINLIARLLDQIYIIPPPLFINDITDEQNEGACMLPSSDPGHKRSTQII